MPDVIRYRNDEQQAPAIFPIFTKFLVYSISTIVFNVSLTQGIG